MHRRMPRCVSVVGGFFLFLSAIFPGGAEAQASPSDAEAMRAVAKGLGAEITLGWSESSDPCTWPYVSCSGIRVTGIQIGSRKVAGVLVGEVRNLTALVRLELQQNRISGALPSLAGLSALQILLLHGNLFSSIPGDFFSGMATLQAASLDHNPFEPWEIPASLKDASSLVNFSANSANVSGELPDFLGSAFLSLSHLGLAYNLLQGGLPASFASSTIQSLWLNNQQGSTPLTGSIAVVLNMSSLTQLWLQSNAFSGPLPDFSALVNLQDLGLRDNRFTGLVPPSLIALPALKKVTLTNNLFQGPVPVFPKTVAAADIAPESGRFCRPDPGDCDPRVTALLSVAKSLGFPTRFAESWRGNDPCAGWLRISCDAGGNVAVVNFRGMGLSGEVSPDFASLKSLQKLWLSDNNLTGTIPPSLVSLSSLKDLDLSNNSLSGPIPAFPVGVSVNIAGNPALGKGISAGGDVGGGGSGSASSGDSSPAASTSPAGGESTGRASSSGSVGIIVGSVLGIVFGATLIGLLVLFLWKRKKQASGRVQSPNATTVIHPRRSGSGEDQVKITVVGNTPSGDMRGMESSVASSDGCLVDAGNMLISIQVLRSVTGGFSEQNIVGSGGFGTVYRGELHDGTMIAVKRMESGVMGSKGLSEFQSEITVLTKVRHRNLVSLLGYCLDGNERLLVYEYMPMGTLSRHLFDWKLLGLKPLPWKKRVCIALDVARAVEYLHSLAHQSFIHRDLKPSNILLADDFRAKVSDFGLVRLAPADGKSSVETRLAGTFGYLAPEYAVTGRVTTKADVFSFGVILMELITGRKALDESRPEESVHLVSWFRRAQLTKGGGAFRDAVDPAIELDEETLAGVSSVAELAFHCCAREPHQRPDMGHAVNVLSLLAELWKPVDPDDDDGLGIDLRLTLPQALKKWKAFEAGDQSGGAAPALPSLSFLASADTTQTSIPTRPSGFADSFTSADGR